MMCPPLTPRSNTSSYLRKRESPPLPVSVPIEAGVTSSSSTPMWLLSNAYQVRFVGTHVPQTPQQKQGNLANEADSHAAADYCSPAARPRSRGGPQMCRQRIGVPVLLEPLVLWIVPSRPVQS